MSLTCAELQDIAAELALGTVSGAKRAAAIEHLAHCTACRDLVDSLARAADSLLLLAPDVEPPPGFESKVLARMGVAPPAPASTSLADVGPRRPGRSGRRRVLVGVAAAAMVAALAGAGVAQLAHDNGRPAGVEQAAPAGVRTALTVDTAGRWTCRAVVYGDNPTWLVVSLDRTDGLSATFSVEAVPAGGSDAVPVGTFATEQGHGTLAQPVSLPAGNLASVRVLDAGGHVRYEMTFPAAT